MPKYTPNPLASNAAGVILDSDDYEFLVGPFKAFENTNAEGNTSFGVRTSLKVESTGSFKGKTVPMTLYFHTPGSEDMSKRFYMAVAGYDPHDLKREEDFNNATKDDDFSFDTETGDVGDFWNRLAGRRVLASVTKEMNERSPSGWQNRFRWKVAE